VLLNQGSKADLEEKVNKITEFQILNGHLEFYCNQCESHNTINTNDAEPNTLLLAECESCSIIYSYQM